MGVLAIVLGILSLVCAFLGTLLFGSTGMIIAIILAVIAIGLAVYKRVKTQKGGIVCIVICVLAIILSFSFNSVWSAAYKSLNEKALELKPDGLWAQASQDTTHGLMGIISKLPQDEASMTALVEEMNELNAAISE